MRGPRTILGIVLIASACASGAREAATDGPPPVGDDIMLNYQSTSYHDIPTLRRLLGKRPTPEFDAWLEDKGIWRGDGPGPKFGDVEAVR